MVDEESQLDIRMVFLDRPEQSCPLRQMVDRYGGSLMSIEIQHTGGMPVRPEFTDAKGVKLLFGLSRSTVYQLAAEGAIKSVSLRRRGNVRGRRLFNCDSIREFIEKCGASEQKGGHQ
jgi:Helix-turn-helix domain